MSFSLSFILYFALGLAMTQIRRSQGMPIDDALFCGVFWPLDLLRRWIDLLLGQLVQADMT